MSANWSHFIICLILAFFAFLFYVTGVHSFLSFLAVGAVDVYLIVVFIDAARRGRGKPPKFELPDRDISLILLLLLILAILFSFSNIYIKSNGIFYKDYDPAYLETQQKASSEITKAEDTTPVLLTNKFEAFYFSAVTLITLGDSNFTAYTNEARWLVLFQLLSTLLLLITGFPLVISRISDFGNNHNNIACNYPTQP